MSVFVLILGLVSIVPIIGMSVRNKLEIATRVHALKEVYRATIDFETTQGRLAAHSIENGIDVSWRVRIYPWITNDGFLGYYDASQSYSSNHNLKAAKSIASSGKAFGACFATNHTSNATILRVGGAGTMGKSGFMAQIPDGAKSTIFAIEDRDSTILWTSTADFMPFDLSDAELARWLSKERRLVLLADGSVGQMNERITASEFRALCTVAGNEDVDVGRLVENLVSNP